MVSIVLAAFAVTTSPAIVQDRSGDPPIRVSLNSYYDRGDHAKVRLRVVQDGYVVVLRVDVDGRIRVLFPLDPGDDDFVRGGREFELRGRGGREAFFVDDRSGTGTVLAARSAQPFRYDRFVRGDHWDYRALANDRVLDDPEAGLLDLVTEMADSAHFDYDVATYTIEQDGRRVYASHYGYRPGYRVGFVFGSRYRCGYYDPIWDPFGCDSYYYDPFYYDPFYYRSHGYYRSYGYGPFGYSCYADPFCYGNRRHGYARARSGGGGIVFKRPVPPPPFVLPRDRAPRNNPGVFDRPPIIRGVDRGVDRRGTAVEPRPRPNVGERRREAGDARGTSWTPPRAERERPREASPRRDSPPRSEATPRRDPPPRSKATPRSDPPPRSKATPRSSGASTRSSGAKPSNPTRRRP
jgi:hypothetical protein